jgi:hypothetical protein
MVLSRVRATVNSGICATEVDEVDAMEEEAISSTK